MTDNRIIISSLRPFFPNWHLSQLDICSNYLGNCYIIQTTKLKIGWKDSEFPAKKTGKINKWVLNIYFLNHLKLFFQTCSTVRLLANLLALVMTCSCLKASYYFKIKCETRFREVELWLKLCVRFDFWKLLFSHFLLCQVGWPMNNFI